MPTYTFRCAVCGRLEDTLCSISHYASEAFRAPRCHDQGMARFFTAPDPTRALDFLTSDAIYDGLRASDGTDISTREKHREYMRSHNLTTVDDFRDTWAEAAKQRERAMQGEDASRAHDIVDAMRKHGG